jgi:hypothetical protein
MFSLIHMHIWPRGSLTRGNVTTSNKYTWPGVYFAFLAASYHVATVMAAVATWRIPSFFIVGTM